MPITNVDGKKAFVADTIRFYGRTDEPIDYQALSSPHQIYSVAKGKAKITDTIVSSTADSYTVRWTARNAATNAPIAGLEIDGPCSKMVTDASGNYTCTIDDLWDTGRRWSAPRRGTKSSNVVVNAKRPASSRSRPFCVARRGSYRTRSTRREHRAIHITA